MLVSALGTLPVSFEDLSVDHDPVQGAVAPRKPPADPNGEVVDDALGLRQVQLVRLALLVLSRQHTSSVTFG